MSSPPGAGPAVSPNALPLGWQDRKPRENMKKGEETPAMRNTCETKIRLS